MTSFPHEVAALELQDSSRPDAIARQHARGKQTARERIAALTDPGSFREIGGLARPDRPATEGRPLLADALVTGTARVDGRAVVLAATDWTVAGGSNGLIGNEKLRRCYDVAASRGIPLVLLLDGGGHRIHEGLDARDFAGGFDIQEVQSRLSGWVPTVAAVLGPGYGQPTIAAAMCDYVVAVRGAATLGMAPPALVQAATGEVVDPDELNGADAQATFGTVDTVVDCEAAALDAIRWYLDVMPQNSEADLPIDVAVPPRADARDRLDEAVPSSMRMAYDMAQVIAGIVDEDSEVELKSAFAPNMITCLARIEGRPLGIMASQPMSRAGMLDTDAAAKAAHLVSLCDAFGVPLLVLIDLPGLAVGKDAERSGLARAGARLSLELGAATVPKATVVARKGFGGGYVIMSGGRTFHPDLVAAWPHAQTAVMAVESAVDLVFRRDLESAGDPNRRRTELIDQHRDTIGAVRGAEGFGYDAVIRPSETRAWLAELLEQAPRRRLMQTLTPRRHPVTPL